MFQDLLPNCTALCVVVIPCRLPQFRGRPTIDVLTGSISNVAVVPVRIKLSLVGMVKDWGLLADRPAPIQSIRALLDIVRDAVQNPGRKPLLLTTHQVSS